MSRTHWSKAYKQLAFGVTVCFNGCQTSNVWRHPVRTCFLVSCPCWDATGGKFVLGFWTFIVMLWNNENFTLLCFCSQNYDKLNVRTGHFTPLPNGCSPLKRDLKDYISWVDKSLWWDDNYTTILIISKMSRYWARLPTTVAFYVWDSFHNFQCSRYQGLTGKSCCLKQHFWLSAAILRFTKIK